MCWTPTGLRGFLPLSRSTVTNLPDGRIYNRRKQQHGGDRSSGQVDHLNTATTVAAELGESEKTIRRNGQRAELHDALREAGDNEAAEIAKTIPQADVARAVKESRDDPAGAAETDL